MNINQAIKKLQGYKNLNQAIAIQWFDTNDIILKVESEHNCSKLSEDELHKVARIMEDVAYCPTEGMNWYTMGSAINEVLEDRLIKYSVTDIVWDYDDDFEDIADLPSTMIIELPLVLDEMDEELDERVSDTITEITGFCHCGFNYDTIAPQ